MVTWQPLGPWGKLENGSHVFKVAEEKVKSLGPWWHWYVCMYVLVAQLCLTLCDPMNCSPPGFSAHGLLQARILEWVAIPFSRGSSQPRDGTWVSCIAGRFFTREEGKMTLGSHHISLKSPLWDILWLDRNYKGFFFFFFCFSSKIQFSLRCHSSCFESRGLSPCLGEQSSQLPVLLNYPWLIFLTGSCPSVSVIP